MTSCPNPTCGEQAGIHTQGALHGYIAAQLEMLGVSPYTDEERGAALAACGAEARGAHWMADALSRILASSQIGLPADLPAEDEAAWWIGYYHGRHAARLPN